MGIAQIFPNYPPRICGVGDYTYFTSVEMARRGIPVTVVTSMGIPENSADGVTVRPVIEKWDRNSIKSVCSALSECRPHVVFLEYAPNAYGRGGIAPWITQLQRHIREDVGSKAIVVCHELVAPLRSKLKSFAASFAHRSQARSLLRGCDAAVVTTEKRRLALTQWEPERADKVAMIPVGSNIPVAPLDEAEKTAIRRRYVRDGAFMLGGFGTLHTIERNFDLLFEALAMLNREGDRASFVWIGDVDRTTPTFERVTASARSHGVEDRISWTGRLDRADVSKHLSALDLYVSVLNGGACFRNGSFLAAVGHGLPIVAISGSEDDARLVDGRHLIMVTPEAGALGDALSRVLSSDALRTSLGNTVLKLHDEHLSWPVVVDQLLRIANRRCDLV